MPAPDPDAVVTAGSDSYDPLSKGGEFLPWIYPRTDIGEHAYDPTQVILEADGSIPVTIAGSSGPIEATIGGTPETKTFTAGVAASELTFSAVTNSLLVKNEEATAGYAMEFSMDDGVTWIELPPGGVIGDNWHVTTIKVRRKGVNDVTGVAIGTV